MRRSRLLMCGFGLLLVLISYSPVFLLAMRIDKDEWKKFGAGFGIAVVVSSGVLAREVWRYAAGSQSNYGTRSVTKTCGLPVVDDTHGYD